MSEVSLKEYFESRISALEKATHVAAQQMDKRLEGMNEFRDALKDQATKFITKDEFNIQHQRVVDDIRTLRESRAKLEGRASQTSVFIAYGLVIVSIIISVIAIFHK